MMLLVKNKKNQKVNISIIFYQNFYFFLIGIKEPIFKIDDP